VGSGKILSCVALARLGRCGPLGSIDKNRGLVYLLKYSAKYLKFAGALKIQLKRQTTCSSEC